MPLLAERPSPSLIMTNVMSQAGRKAQPVHVLVYCMDKHLAPLPYGA